MLTKTIRLPQLGPGTCWISLQTGSTCELGMKQLESDGSPCRELFGSEHLAHAAVADHLKKAVAAIEISANERCFRHRNQLLDRHSDDRP